MLAKIQQQWQFKTPSFAKASSYHLGRGSSCHAVDCSDMLYPELATKMRHLPEVSILIVLALEITVFAAQEDEKHASF